MCGFTVNKTNSLKISGVVVDLHNNQPISDVNIAVKGTAIGAITDKNGKFSIQAPEKNCTLIFNAKDYDEKQLIVEAGKQNLMVQLASTKSRTNEVADEEESFGDSDFRVMEEVVEFFGISQSDSKVKKSEASGRRMKLGANYNQEPPFPSPHNTEEYDHISENIFHDPQNAPLSTFSIDVDAASYSNLRRVLNSGQKPYKDMVRIEEMINYFSYNYPNPTGKRPFSINTEVSTAPWNAKHKLVHIGIQGKKLDYENTDPSNLVFLIDVSGSMSAENKLPLLKRSLKMLVNNLGEKDRIAIVAYAGAAGLVLPPTPASEKTIIHNALDRLSSGGSTAGGQGIKLAYKVAEQNLLENGNNRVILATDGDFNVGISSTSEMIRMIEEKRKSGIFLTITGFGMGNYKDGRMEQISNAGNGNYFYIDNINEARKVFVKEMSATLFTIAKDVKIQVEFNPDKVQAYRLIGYENRKLNDEDFNDDTKDAGELGAGHSVTALYEIIPTGIQSSFIVPVDELKYQRNSDSKSSDSNELLTVKFRYKRPKETKSNLIVEVLQDTETDINVTSGNFRFSASVAEFGMLLRESEYKQNSSYSSAINLALGAKGEDTEGYRTEFISLVRNMEWIGKEEF
ncbi:MAG: von Willebrand factor type A domain-containing protein [Cyclobacteriaceae bacterium]